MMKKRTLTYLLCLSLSMMSVGCSGFFVGQENLSEPVDLPDNTHQIRLNNVWKKQIGDGTDGKTIQLEPAVVGNRVFAVSADGELVALDLSTGKTQWEQSIGHRIAAGVAADANLAVVGNDNGLLLAFDANTGARGWTYQMNSEVISTPSIINGLVIARSIDGQVVALDARRGEVIWKQYIGVADLSIRGNAKGVYIDGMMLFTNGRGRLTILSIKDGSQIFSVPVVLGKGLTNVDRIADLLATPVIRNGVLYLSAYRHKTLALNMKDGSPLWESPYATADDLFADGKYVYVIDKNSFIRALDLQTGQLVWTSKALEGRRISPLIGNGQWVATVDLEGELIFLDAQRGQIMGYQSVGSERAYVAPKGSSQGLVTYTADGDLTLINISGK